MWPNFGDSSFHEFGCIRARGRAGTCALALACTYVRVPYLMAALVMKPLMEGLFTSAYAQGRSGAPQPMPQLVMPAA